MKGQFHFSRAGTIILAAASLVFAFIFITSFVPKLEDQTRISLCRAAVCAQEKTSLANKLWGGLCHTNDVTFPSTEKPNRDTVMQQFADAMVDCRQMFCDATVDDPFKQGNPTTNNCFVCAVVTTEKKGDFKQPITQADFSTYLSNTVHTVAPQSDFCSSTGGKCVNSESQCDAISTQTRYEWEILKNNDQCPTINNVQQQCCSTRHGCISKGGQCQTPDWSNTEYTKYTDAPLGWGCPGDLQCFIENNHFFSIANRLQFFEGKSNVVIATDIEPNEVYAISYGAPTKECEWCTILGRGSGAAAGTALLLFTPVGLVGAIVIGGALIAADEFAGYGVGSLANKGTNYFIEDRTHTIYLTTLNQIQGNKGCNIVSKT